MMEVGSSESEEETNLKKLMNEERDACDWFARYAMRLKMHNRIKKLSEEELKKEATWKEGEKRSVFHRAAGNLRLPFDAIDRLCDALGIDSKDTNGNTVIMYAASIGNYDIVEYLARNKQADLSITDIDGDNVYTVVGRNPHTPQEVKEKTYRVL
jgi:ankyrin repeat protein